MSFLLQILSTCKLSTTQMKALQRNKGQLSHANHVGAVPVMNEWKYYFQCHHTDSKQTLAYETIIKKKQQNIRYSLEQLKGSIEFEFVSVVGRESKLGGGVREWGTCLSFLFIFVVCLFVCLFVFFVVFFFWLSALHQNCYARENNAK